MPMHAVLLLRLKEAPAPSTLALLRERFLTEFGLTSEDFYPGGPLLALSNSATDPAPDDGASWISTNLLRSYYGPGYERGDIDFLVRAAEWFERWMPGCEPWYGPDIDAPEGIVAFDAAERERLLDHSRRAGWRGSEGRDRPGAPGESQA